MNIAFRSLRSAAVQRRPGGLHGVGLFALRDLKPGELLALKGGALFDHDFAKSHETLLAGSHHQVAPNLFLGGTTPTQVDDTLIGYNHSCEANAYIDGHIALRANRAVYAGAEITVDYATIFATPTQSFECGCGSQNCRGVVAPDFSGSHANVPDNRLAFFLKFPERYDVDLVPIDPNVPTTSWVNSKVERVDSKINGIGSKAKLKIMRDELIGIHGGVLVTGAELAKLPTQAAAMAMQISDDVFTSPVSELDRKASLIGINHSCDPNCYPDGQIGVFARRDIDPGEELTADYATCYISDSQQFKCECRSQNCRGEIDTSRDWQDADVQAFNQGTFAEFIQKKIDGQQDVFVLER